MNPVVAEATNLRKVYPIRRGMFREPAQLQAVGGVSFRLEQGKTLAVVGESGCGKSTLARMVALIEKPTGGELTLDGTDAVATPAEDKRRLRQAVQLVFQNPYGSLNPRKKISAVRPSGRRCRGLPVRGACSGYSPHTSPGKGHVRALFMFAPWD